MNKSCNNVSVQCSKCSKSCNKKRSNFWLNVLHGMMDLRFEQYPNVLNSDIKHILGKSIEKGIVNNGCFLVSVCPGGKVTVLLLVAFQFIICSDIHFMGNQKLFTIRLTFGRFINVWFVLHHELNCSLHSKTWVKFTLKRVCPRIIPDKSEISLLK